MLTSFFTLFAMVAWAISGTGYGAGQCWGAEAATSSRATVHSDIRFADADGVALFLDLHLPVEVENPPLVMFIHGGGWTGGDRKGNRLEWILPYGFAIARIEYRLSQEAIFPAQIYDCKGALRWLRAHQQQYGYDAKRVVAAGTSAGGHLAALMGTSGGVAELEGKTAGYEQFSSRVQGVIDYFGPTDFLLRSKDQPAKTEEPAGSVYQLLGGPVREKQALARLASPVFHVDAEDPPLLMLHGEKDQLVHLSQSQRLLSSYQSHHLDGQLHIEGGQGHGWRPPSAQEQKLVLQFLGKHLRSDERPAMRLRWLQQTSKVICQ